MFLGASHQARAGVRATSAAPVVAPAKAVRGSDSDGTVLTEEQLKDHATLQDAGLPKVLAFRITRTFSRPSTAAALRLIPAVLRL